MIEGGEDPLIAGTGATQVRVDELRSLQVVGAGEGCQDFSFPSATTGARESVQASARWHCPERRHGCRPSRAWYLGIERPDVEIFNSRAAVEVVEGGLLREHNGQPTGAVFRPAGAAIAIANSVAAVLQTVLAVSGRRAGRSRAAVRSQGCGCVRASARKLPPSATGVTATATSPAIDPATPVAGGRLRTCSSAAASVSGHRTGRSARWSNGFRPARR